MTFQQISTEAEYRSALQYIEPFLQKGFDHLTPEEDEELARVSLLIQEYENIHYSLPFQPATLIEVIEKRMAEMKLRQKDMSKLLGITENRISEVLNNKRKINLDLAKRLHQKLNISAEFILNQD